MQTERFPCLVLDHKTTIDFGSIYVPPSSQYPSAQRCTMSDTPSSSELSDLPISTWKAEPTFRGTFNILSTCIGTLTICVWSAVHINIPSRRSPMITFLKKLGWMVVGIVAPEALLYIAYREKSIARSVLKYAHERLDLPAPPDPWYRKYSKRLYSRVQSEGVDAMESTVREKGRAHYWTLNHAFYSISGGCAFDFSAVEHSEKESPPSTLLDRVVVAPAGIRFLLDHEPDLIPDIPIEFIKDRSKTDSLSKAILFVQVFWFCISCISRGIQGLPLSLLEVSTMAHAICTLFTYVIWWSKPSISAEPTIIGVNDRVDVERARSICALMMMCSPRCKVFLAGIVGFHDKAEIQSITLAKNIPRPGQYVQPDIRTGQVVMRPGEYLEGTPFGPGRLPSRKGLLHRLEGRLTELSIYGKRINLPWYHHPRPIDETITLKRKDVERWQLAAQALQTYKLNSIRLDTYVDSDSSLQTTSFVAYYNLQDLILSLHLPIAILTAIYGLPHLIGWNASFPTTFERFLWRVCAIILTCAGTMAGTIAVFMQIMKSLGTFNIGRGVYTLSVTVVTILYMVSSVYTVLEALRQLLFLPPQVYQLPAWSNYFPHVA